MADTICAIATGAGGAIGIVRVSGAASEAIVRRLAPAMVALESHRLRLVTLRDPDSGETLDRALVCLMRAPASYTGEDVLELHGHGGPAQLARLLAAVVGCGARLATPGEFTRRAFLAGRMDLARAEAVAEVIGAQSERAARLAQAHLSGAVSSATAQLRLGAIEVLAEVEGAIDFPEEAHDAAPGPALAATVARLAADAGRLAGSHRLGRCIADGLDVALVGRPNGGKSSLLNRLAGEERALVDRAPGTTRDFLEVEVGLDGVRVTLVDTAGEREASDALEQRGVALGRQRRARADVFLLVVDGTEGWSAIEGNLVRAATAGSQAVVVCWNKCDLRPMPAGIPDGLPVVRTSAVTGEGLDELVVVLRAHAAGPAIEEGVVVSSARQAELFERAALALRRAEDGLVAEAPGELVAADLRAALERLGEVTGEAFDDAVLDQVFSRFCIGK